MIKLGVNIDHVATIRQARGTKYPSVVQAALRAEQSGADSITLHLREDRRHMQDADIFALRPLLQTKMNLEVAVTDEMIGIACQVKPQDVCLVPERREERTTEGGLDVIAHFDKVQAACKKLAAHNIRVSLFIGPELNQIDAAKKVGAPVIELHTGHLCCARPPPGPSRKSTNTASSPTSTDSPTKTPAPSSTSMTPTGPTASSWATVCR